jgi:hypothetical protein
MGCLLVLSRQVSGEVQLQPASCHEGPLAAQHDLVMPLCLEPKHLVPVVTPQQRPGVDATSALISHLSSCMLQVCFGLANAAVLTGT